MENGAGHISSGRALERGFAQGLNLWPAGLSAFAAGGLEVLCEAFLALGLWAWLSGAKQALVPAVGAWLGLWLMAQLLRAVVQGGALRQGALALKGSAPGAFLPQLVAAAGRSLTFLLWALLLDAISTAWRWLGLIAGGWAFFSAVGSGRVGGLASGALALALVLGLALGLGWALLRREAFVRSVAFDQSALISFHEAALALIRRPWPRLVVFGATALLALMAQLVVASMAGAITRSGPMGMPSFSLTFSAELVTGLLLAFVAAILELAALQGFLAIQLDETGALPRPAPPAEPPMATLIPDVQLLPDPPEPV